MILASVPPVHLILSVLAAIAYAWPALRAQHLSLRAAKAWVGVAWAAARCRAGLEPVGRATAFRFAPALSVTTWLVAAVYGVESQFYPQLPTRWALSAVGGAAVLLAFVFPGSAMPTTTSVWLPVHLAFGVACYGLFGTAVVHAWFMTRAEKHIRHAEDPHSGLPLLTLERLTYRFVAGGFVLLSLTLALGFLYGDVLYGHGHAWHWDHKTVFSVLAWITFAALLIGRTGFGWRGRRAVGMLYTGSAFLLLAYVGSRFVLEIILGRTP